MEEFLNYIKEQGWKVVLHQKKGKFLPQVIKERYERVPQLWLDFINTVRSIQNNEETTWFLCQDVFDGQKQSAFSWNEWETLSLDSAGHDIVWEMEIKEFWNRHLPIIMSVQNGYAYYAICVEDGSIVYGAEPEFEACTIVAPSFEAFLRKIVQQEISI